MSIMANQIDMMSSPSHSSANRGQRLPTGHPTPGAWVVGGGGGGGGAQEQVIETPSLGR